MLKIYSHINNLSVGEVGVLETVLLERRVGVNFQKLPPISNTKILDYPKSKCLYLPRWRRYIKHSLSVIIGTKNCTLNYLVTQSRFTQSLFSKRSLLNYNLLTNSPAETNRQHYTVTSAVSYHSLTITCESFTPAFL